MRKYLSLVLVFFISASAFAQDMSFLPNEPVGMVNDFAGMMTRSEANMLDRKLTNYRDTTTNVIAIATIESLQGVSVEEAGTELFNKWRMWEGDRYNGVLILVSEGDRKIRIEVGYGLEGAIPDVMANRIINEIITPGFREGDVYGALDRATNAMIQLASGEYEGTPEGLRNDSDGDFPVDVIIIIIVIIIFIVTKGGRGGGRRRRTLGPVDVLLWGHFLGGGGRNHGGGSSWGGGGSFGGGGGFGGFSGGGGFGSGGGGASGGW